MANDTLQAQKQKQAFKQRQAAATPEERKKSRKQQITRRLEGVIKAGEKAGLTKAQALAKAKEKLRAKGVNI